MSKKKPIQVINNYKALLEVIPSNIDNNTYMFNENITSIVNQRQNKIDDYMISEIIKFMEKENIQHCFVINKKEMADCLQEHNILHLKIKDLQTQLNQQKAMWKKLKEWVSFTQPKNIKDEFFIGACSAYSNMKNKMQDLEKGEKDYICDCTYIKEPDYTNICRKIDKQIKELKG